MAQPVWRMWQYICKRFQTTLFTSTISINVYLFSTAQRRQLTAIDLTLLSHAVMGLYAAASHADEYCAISLL